MFDDLPSPTSSADAPQLLTRGSYLLMVAAITPVLTRSHSDSLAAEFLVLESDSAYTRTGDRAKWIWSLSTTSPVGISRCKEFAMALWQSVGWAPTHFADHPEQLAEFLKGDSWLGAQVAATGTMPDLDPPESMATRMKWDRVKQVPGVGRALLDPASDPDGAFTSAERLALEAGGTMASAGYWMGRAQVYRRMCGA